MKFVLPYKYRHGFLFSNRLTRGKRLKAACFPVLSGNKKAPVKGAFIIASL